MTSPSDGSRHTSAWLPLRVHLSKRFVGGHAAVSLNGEDITDPDGYIRRRVDYRGGGADYLGTLYLADLEPGHHDLDIEFHTQAGDRTSTHTSFEWAPPPCAVTVNLRDAQGTRVPGTAMAIDADGERVDQLGDDAEADPSHRDIAMHSVPAPDGEALLFLHPGDYRIIGTRDLRHGIDERAFHCDEDGGATTVHLQPAPTIDTAGTMTADFHLHTGRSADSFLPDKLRWRAVVASSIDLVVLTDHNRVRDPTQPLADILQGSTGTRGLRGIEARVGMSAPEESSGEESAGHINAFPVDPITAIPSTLHLHPGWQLEAWRDFQEISPYRLDEPRIVLQLNHPRGIQFRPDRDPQWTAHAFFHEMQYDTDQPLDAPDNHHMVAATPRGTRPIDFDAMEIINRFSWREYKRVRRDWFALLNEGIWLTGTGNSDSHAYEIEPVGYPLNLVRCPATTPDAELDYSCVISAVHRGALTVSNGPVVDLLVRSGDTLAVPGDDISAAGELIVAARVQAAAWVPVAEARLIVNGQALGLVDLSNEPREPDGTLDTIVTWTTSVNADSWILVEAGWPISLAEPEDPTVLGDYRHIAPHHVPIGFTNPVRVDADGDGDWQPSD